MIEKKSKLLKKKKYEDEIYRPKEQKGAGQVFPEQAKEDKRGPMEDTKSRDFIDDVRANYRWLFATCIVMFGFLTFAQVGCKPQTTTQKIEDKVEDAGHEIKQGAERAKENVDDATRKK